MGTVGTRSRVPDTDSSSSEDDDSDSTADDEAPRTARGMSTCQGRWDPWCFEVCPPAGDAWPLSVSAASDRPGLPPHPTIPDTLCTYAAPNTAYLPVYLGREPAAYSFAAVGYGVYLCDRVPPSGLTPRQTRVYDLVLRGHWIVDGEGRARHSAHFWMADLTHWVRAARGLAHTTASAREHTSSSRRRSRSPSLSAQATTWATTSRTGGACSRRTTGGTSRSRGA